MEFTEVEQIYNNLSQREKDLIHILTFYRDISDRSVEYYLWSMIGGNREGIWRYDKFDSKEIKAGVKLMQGMGYFKANNTINEEVYAYLFSFAMQDSHFSARIVASMAWGELMIGYLGNVNKAFRNCYFYLFRQGWEDFNEAFIFLTKNFSGQFHNQDLMKAWVNFAPTLDLILAIPDKYSYPIWRYTLLQGGIPQERHFLATEKILLASPTAMKNDAVLSVLFEGYYFRGDEAKMNEYLAQISDKSWHKSAKTAWLLMSKGQYNNAIDAFEIAIKAYRKETNTKKYYFRDFNAVLYHFCYFKLRNMVKILEIQEFLLKVPAETPHYVAFIYQLALCKYFQNQKNEANILLNRYDFYATLPTWIYYLVHSLMGEKPERSLKELEEVYEMAVFQNNHALALEMATVLTNLNPRSVSFANAADSLRNKLNRTPIAPSEMEQSNEWEIALNALEMTFLKAESKTTAVKTLRLIFLVDFEREFIQPKEQSLNKNGTWSAGKNIALKRLKESPPAYLEPQDYRIIRYLQEYEVNTGYYYSKIEWDWNYAKAYEEMVGHPLLFLEKSPNVAVELVKEEVQLRVVEVKGKYEVALSVDDFDREGAKIVKETPTRYKLFPITKAHLQFKQAIGGKKLMIPKEGKERLGKITAGLSSMMTIQSDIAETNQNLPSVAADARMYIHLLPMGEGFSLEMFSKPFQSTPPYFAPGKGGENVIAELNGIKTQTKRKLKLEKENYKDVEKACPTLANNSSGDGVWLLEDAEECLDVLMELDNLRKEEKIVIEWPKGEKLRVAHKADFSNFSFSINKKQDWFEVEGELKLDSGLVMGMQELLDLVGKSGNEYIQLADGQYLALTKAFQKKLKEMNEIVGDKGKKGLQVHPLSALMMEDFTSNLKHVKTDKAWKEQVEKIKASRSISPKLSPHFEAELRPYQMEGYTWLHQLAHWGVGACLADDMGLGKTIQALAVILDRAKEGPTLVVAPVSVCRNWEKEAHKFAPTLTPILFQGTIAERKEIIEQIGTFDLLITSYGLLQQEIEVLAAKHFTTIVLDEAQAIKNHQTKRAKAALDLQGDFKVITTGTPIENHLGELWSLFSFINPGFLGSMQGFQERFANPIEKYGNKEKKQMLKKLITPFILRRRKNEVLDDLPAKTEITLTVQLSEEERAFYEALRQNALKALENQDAGDIRFQILAEITRLRRACCNPKLVTPNVPIESSKLKLFDEVVEELLENGHRALVFSQYVGHLEILKQHLDEKEIEYQYLDGSTPANKRQESVDAFQKGKGDLFLISLKAGGTGLNLTAADYVIHMDPWWNPAVEDQASDRAHRIGQKRPVTVYRLVTENTIEEKILALHHDKRDLADSLLEGTDSSSKLSAEDLLNLLKG